MNSRIRIRDRDNKLLCLHCDTPVADLDSDVLTLLSKDHHGEVHISKYVLRELLDIAQKRVYARQQIEY